MTCATGYLGTAASLTCQSSGSWTAQSGCTIRNCGTPVASTGYTLGSGSTTYGSTYSMTCASGYLGTAASLTCQSSGSWTAQSGCTIRDCGTPVASTGYVVYYGSATTFGSTYSMACATGYLGTAASLTCQSSGSWTAQSGCTIGDCGIPVDEVGYIVNAPETSYEAIAIPACAEGFNGTPLNLTCQASLEWTAYGGCERNDCGDPAVTGYVFAANFTTFEAVATAMCDEGAGYLGAPTTDIYCLADSQWSNVSGCVLVDCDVPDFGVGYLVTGTTTFYGSTVTVSCSPGFDGASSTITCQDSGLWTDPSVCTRITQPPASSAYSGTAVFFSAGPSVTSGVATFATLAFAVLF